MKDGDRHRRDEDREVEAEGADQKQHEQDRLEVGPLPNVAKAFDQTAAGGDGAAARFRGTMRRKPSEHSTARNERALIRNTHPVPTPAIRTPAMAGPIMRAALNDVEFSATAFGRSPSPTSSATKVCRAGESNAAAQPSRNANT